MFSYDLTSIYKRKAKSEYIVTPPSVTGILSKTKLSYDNWLDKVESGFDFEAEKKKLENNYVVAKAMSRGRKVAKALETDTDSTDEATNKILDEMRLLMCDLKVVEKECPLIFKDIYWGKADIVGYLGDSLVIADNKSVNRPLQLGKNGSPRPSTYKDYALQVTAYAKAHNEMFGTQIRTGLLYFVEGDGTGELSSRTIEIEVDDYWDEWQYRVRDFYQRETIIKQQQLSYYTRRIKF